MKSISLKIPYATLTALFVYFSVVQLNDPDALQWILIYGVVALVSFLSLFSFNLKKLKLGLLTVIAVLFLFNLPLFFDWINAGQPAFIDYEPTNIKEAEKMREFFGLFIALIACAILYFFEKKSVPK